MSAEDDVYLLAGDEPTLWAYPSQVHPSDEQNATATGRGAATVTLAVTLARDATGVAVLDVSAQHHPIGPPAGGGGNRYPTRIHHPVLPEEPEDEPDPDDDDVLALILLGVL